jgi:hypothetical protein
MQLYKDNAPENKQVNAQTENKVNKCFIAEFGAANILETLDK